MNTLKLISLCPILSLSLLQAADPDTQSDKMHNEECALPDYITVPDVFGQGKPEKVSSNNKDSITHLTFKEHIQRADNKDLLWIMVSNQLLINNEALACNYYNDARAFNNRYMALSFIPSR